jgi:hypothetical protein
MLDADTPNESRERLKKNATLLLTALGWLAVSGLLLYAYFMLQDLLNMLLALTSWYQSSKEALRQGCLIVSGLIFLSFIVISGELHGKYAGQARSFWLFGVTLVGIFTLWLARWAVILSN